jgi:signal transduction histidine kinase/FixJ family two-component response regulator
MANRRVLVVGSQSPLSRQLLAGGHLVDHAPASQRPWTALPSGAWDACILDPVHLREGDPDLVRRTRATQPGLALLVASADEVEGSSAALLSGADDWIAADCVARPAAEVLSSAVATRRERARGRTLPPVCRVVVLDWDQLEAPLVRGALARHHFSVCYAGNGRAALEALRERQTHVLVTPPSASVGGHGVVEAALRYDPRLRIIVTSDHLDLEGTAAAIGHGAQDYLLRPVGPAQALGTVTDAWAAYANTAPSGEARERLLEVLVLGSHPVQAHLVEEMLAQEGRFSTTLVHDVGEARRCLSERNFDAIVCRPDGPRSDALCVLQELRSMGPLAAIVVIANRAGSDVHEQALRMGAQDVIIGQRLGREALGTRVRNAVSRNQYRLAHERFVRDLQTREASQREVVLHSGDGMLIVDAADRVVFSNPAADRMFERCGPSMLGQSFPYPPASGHREIAIREISAPGVADMTEVSIDWNGTPVRLVSLRDVTERRQAEELRDRLAHSERLAAIGQLAAGVTHEINNPAAYVVANLTTMLDRVQSLQQRPLSPDTLPQLDELAEMLRENLDGMARIRSIASDLRTFARIGRNEVSLVDLNECVESACKIAKSEIRQRARLVRELGDIPRLPGSPGKLAQVVLNLLINAAQAVPEGDVEGQCITVRTGSGGEEVWLQVEDTGHGLPLELRDKIFDPFFTTKPRSQGTGLGLALCADIVGQHQGVIRAHQTPNGGTCFEVRFPRDTQLTPSAPPPALPSRVVPKSRSPRLRLLLIDDEPLVLRSLCRMLAEHDVETANGGIDALSRLKQDARYDLILCDLMMPDMDGTVLYAELGRTMPDVLERVVFCSGGAFTTRTKQFVEQSERRIIEKPLTREAFEALIAELQLYPRGALADSTRATA